MKFDLSSVLRKSSTTAIISILLAVVGWFVVVYSISPSDTAEISGIPVQISLPATSDLNIVDGKNSTVNVKVEGMRYNIGNLRPSDIVLRAVLTDVSLPGTYDLTVEAVKPLDNRYEVTNISPETIRVTFDRELSKSIVIEQEITGLTVPDEDYMLGDISIDPGQITIQGPEKEINRVERAVIRKEFSEPVNKSQTLTLPIVFLDSYGNEVKTKLSGEGYIAASYDTTTVHLPVMRVVELPLTLSFVNVPDEFPIDELEYSISNETITVAATEDVVNRYYEISVGHIDISNLDLTRQSSLTFNIEMPDNMINYNNIESVVVEFDAQELASKTVKIKNITALNVPPNYNVQIKTNSLSVKMIGDSKTIESLTPDAMIAEIDFSTQDITAGQYSMPVRLYLPTSDLVWAIGKYTAVISVTEK